MTNEETQWCAVGNGSIYGLEYRGKIYCSRTITRRAPEPECEYQSVQEEVFLDEVEDREICVRLCDLVMQKRDVGLEGVWG